MNEEKKLNLPQSLLLLLLIILSVAVCIRLKTGGPMIGLFASWIFIYLFCVAVRIPYSKVVDGAFEAIRMVVSAYGDRCHDRYLAAERYHCYHHCMGT